MDETSLSTPPTAEHAPPAENSRGDRRRRAREILSTQCSRLDRLEGELSQRMQEVADEIGRELSASGGEQTAVVADLAHEARLAALSQQVDRLRGELAAREDALRATLAEVEQSRLERASAEQELRVRDALVAEAQSRDERTRVELANLMEQMADAQAQLAAVRQRQDELRRERAAEQELFEVEQEKAKEQRHIVAREFKARHAEQVAQLEDQQAGIARLQQALAESSAEKDRLVGELRQAAGPRADEAEELHNLRRERDSLSDRLAAAVEQLAELDRMSARLENARLETAKVQQEVRVRETQLAETQSHADRYRGELTALAGQLADAQARMGAADERLAEMARMASELEQSRIVAARLEQELRVREALVAEAQSHDERIRVDLATATQRLADAEARLIAADQRLAETDRTAAAFERARIEAGRLEQELHVRDTQLAEAQAHQERNRAELATAVERLGDVQAQLVAARECQEGLRREADAQNELFTAREQELKAQRRRVARQYRSKYAAQLAELEGREAEVHNSREVLAVARAEQERLAGELRELAAARSADQDQLNNVDGRHDAIVQKLAAAEARQAESDRVAAQLEQARIEAARLEQELHVRDAQLSDGRTREEKSRAELASLVERLSEEERQLTAARTQLTAASQRAAESDRVAVELEHSRIEGAKIEQELRVRDAILTEAQTQQEKGRVELAATLEQLNDVRAQLSIARERQEELRHEAAAAQAAAQRTPPATFGDHDGETAQLRESLEAAHLENHRLVGQLAETSGVDSDELKKLRKERDALTKKLAAAESKLKEASQQEPDTRGKDDLQKRLEMAVEDLREIKHINAELEAKLKGRGSSGGATAAVSADAMDWEAQKQRMLASLAEDDCDDEEAVEQRETIEGTIRITDQVVEQKDREIAELKRQLEEQSGNSAADSAAVAELLDHDEVIRQEREKLVQVQAEWREKIGKAEIDISVERARIARERMQLEEKLRVYQNEQADRPVDGTGHTSEKPVRGRWLARLGLKDLNEE